MAWRVPVIVFCVIACTCVSQASFLDNLEGLNQVQAVNQDHNLQHSEYNSNFDSSCLDSDGMVQFEGHNYFFQLNTSCQGMWKDAETFCKGQNMSLLSIETHSENMFLNSYLYAKSLNGSYVTHFWTSGRNDLDGVKWTATGQRLTYNNFQPGHPIRYDPSLENNFECVLITWRSIDTGEQPKWWTDRCNKYPRDRQNYICEGEI